MATGMPTDRGPGGTGGGTDPHDKSIGELLKELSQETTTLVKQELDLAKAEMAQKGKEAGVGAGLVGGAGFMALLTGIAFTAFAILALAGGMKDWLAALIVTLVYAAIAGVLALQGKNKLQETSPKPEQTIDTLKEDAAWAKTRKPSGAR